MLNYFSLYLEELRLKQNVFLSDQYRRAGSSGLLLRKKRGVFLLCGAVLICDNGHVEFIICTVTPQSVLWRAEPPLPVKTVEARSAG